MTEDQDRPRGADVATQMAASGALDEVFARIDAGDLELTGDGGFIPGLIKAALERGLQAELTDHLGYDRSAPEASLFTNSRNGTTPKTLACQVGDVPLEVPRDRDGTFTPRLVPKGTRWLGGLDEMIISLYAGGMTIRDIQHHLASTIGTALSHETISKIADEIGEEVLAWHRRPLEALYPVIYLDALVVKVRDGAARGQQGRASPSGSTWTASSTCSGCGSKPVRAPSSGPAYAPIFPTAASATY